MKRIKENVYIALVFFLTVMTSACTRHNGDIGDLFGEWRLERLTADGVEQQLYDSEDESAPILYTFAFQGNLIRINSIYQYYRVADCYGTWLIDEDILQLRFTYDDNLEGTDYLYNPPKALHLSPSGITRLDIVSLNGKNMQLSYIDEAGVEYNYYLTHPH